MNILSKHARICFVGDSITAHNKYVAHIARFFLEECPDADIQVFNCGCAGGASVSQYTFFKDDIEPHRPTHIFLMLGINESGLGILEDLSNPDRYNLMVEKYEAYKVNYARLCDACVGIGAKLVLMTLPPYDEYEQVDTAIIQGGYALTLGFRNFVMEYAKEKGYPCIDIHQYLTRHFRDEVLFVDRVHPNERGHYYMAKYILKELGYDIGEQKDYPEYMDEWREKEEHLRQIYAAEKMVIGLENYGLSTEEKIKLAQKYVDEEKWNIPERSEKGNLFFYNLAKEYIELKPKQAQLYEEIDKIIVGKFFEIGGKEHE